MTVYLDNGATTRLAPEVREAMLPWLGERWGNPSSSHRLGLDAARAVKQARRDLADSLGCAATEVVLTSGGTEADALAVIGGALGLAGPKKPGHIVVSAIEHPAVLESAGLLKDVGWDVTEIGVDGQGLVSPDAIAQAMRDDTALVSVMLVNNELGAVQPIEEIVRAAKARKSDVLVHTDAVQAFTKLQFDVRDLGVDLLSVSGHKFHGPTGTGALYVRSTVRLRPLLAGGGQEGGRRSGTENVPGAVGLAAAARLGCQDLSAKVQEITARRDRLHARLSDSVDGLTLNGPPSGPRRVCHNLHISVTGCESASLLHAMEAKGVYASAGSACHSKDAKLSHVLQAVGAKARGEAHLRLTLSRDTTDEDVDKAAAAFVAAIAELRRRPGGGVHGP